MEGGSSCEKGKSSVGRGSTEKSIIPESVTQAVNRTSENMEDFKAHFDEFMSLCSDPLVLSQLEPLQRAQSLLLLAKATTTLFTLRLRCRGVNPEDNPVKSEIERLSLYEEKLQRAKDLSKAPLRPSATINAQAATRFIEHSLPDLTLEQRKSMREISKGEGTKINYSERSVNKKRKYQTTEKQNVRAAAQEFLEKAAKELRGDNKSDIMGPILIDDSDEDVQTMD